MPCGSDIWSYSYVGMIMSNTRLKGKFFLAFGLVRALSPDGYESVGSANVASALGNRVDQTLVPEYC
jgi:hypothetical protein